MVVRIKAGITNQQNECGVRYWINLFFFFSLFSVLIDLNVEDLEWAKKHSEQGPEIISF